MAHEIVLMEKLIIFSYREVGALVELFNELNFSSFLGIDSKVSQVSPTHTQ